MILNRSDLYLRDTRRIETRLSNLKQEPSMTSTSTTPKDHNQAPPAEAIVAVQLSQMRRAQEEAASQNGAMRSAFAKAEAKGLNLAAAKRALKILKSGKAEDFAAEMKELLRYLNILGVGLQKSQLDLFETAATLAPIDEKAFEDGLRAGRLGENADNPHDLNTAAGQRWLDGHHRGAEERRLILAMEAEEEASAKVVSAEEAEEGQGAIEDAPFGEDKEWPDDRDIAGRAAAE